MSFCYSCWYPNALYIFRLEVYSAVPEMRRPFGWWYYDQMKTRNHLYISAEWCILYLIDDTMRCIFWCASVVFILFLFFWQLLAIFGAIWQLIVLLRMCKYAIRLACAFATRTSTCGEGDRKTAEIRRTLGYVEHYAVFHHTYASIPPGCQMRRECVYYDEWDYGKFGI